MQTVHIQRISLFYYFYFIIIIFYASVGFPNSNLGWGKSDLNHNECPIGLKASWPSIMDQSRKDIALSMTVAVERQSFRRAFLYGPDSGESIAAVGMHIGGPALQFLFAGGYAAVSRSREQLTRDLC